MSDNLKGLTQDQMILQRRIRTETNPTRKAELMQAERALQRRRQQALADALPFKPNRDQVPIHPHRLMGYPDLTPRTGLAAANPDSPVDVGLRNFQEGANRTGGLKDLALNFLAAVPGVVGDAQSLGNMFGIGPQQLGRNLGVPVAPSPDSNQLAQALGADPETRTGLLGQMLSPLPNEISSLLKIGLPAAGAAMGFQKIATELGGETPALARASMRGGPLLHASPHRFEWFDPKHLGKGEGNQAYSAGGFYFSDADLRRGTHGVYLSQFGNHPALETIIETPGGLRLIADQDLSIAQNSKAITDELSELMDEQIDPLVIRSIAQRAKSHARHTPRGAQTNLADNVARDYELQLERLEQTYFDLKFERDRLAQSLREATTFNPRKQAVIRDKINNLDAQIGDMEKPDSSFSRQRDSLNQAIRVLDTIDLSKGEPWSYQIEVADDIKDNLPVYNWMISDQPEKYRENVRALAKKYFDRDEIMAELQEITETLEAFGELGGVPWTPAEERKINAAVQGYRNRADILRARLDVGFDENQTFGELVERLRQERGDEAAQRMMFDAGIPGSRNVTWKSRQALRTPIGAVKSMFEKPVFNYAIWDLDVIDEVVRRKTKGGKILEDSAEVVYRKAAPKLAPKVVPAGQEGELADGFLRFRHFSNTDDLDRLTIDKFGTGIRGAERARDPVPVISAYPDTGFTKEAGLGSNELVIDVPKSRMYDANADPENLMEQAQEASGSFHYIDGKMVPIGTRTNFSKFEQLVKDSGYLGYYTPEAEGNLKGQARFFHDLIITK